jgi:hypothetical protein
MIGGPPVYYPQPVQPASYPYPGYGYPQSPRPVAQAPVPRQAVARGSRPEEPQRRLVPTPVRIPTPEELGVAPAQGRTAEEAVNWPAVFQRLRELKARGYASEPLASGQYRFRCLLPKVSGDGTEVVEAQAASEAEAIRQGLASAARRTGH